MELKSRCLVKTLCGFKDTLSELLLEPVCVALFLNLSVNLPIRTTDSETGILASMDAPIRTIRVHRGMRTVIDPKNWSSVVKVRPSDTSGRIAIFGGFSHGRDHLASDHIQRPVPSDQVGRLSNDTSEFHAVTVGLLWIAKNARQGEVVLVCYDSEYAQNMACGLWKPRANWKAVSKANSACSLSQKLSAHFSGSMSTVTLVTNSTSELGNGPQLSMTSQVKTEGRFAACLET